MRILTLWQPWASFIALGLKQCETRSWPTNYRGKLAIHAAKRPVDSEGIRVWLNAQELAGVTGDPRFHTYLNLPLGKIVAIADLTACRMMNLEEEGELRDPFFEWIGDQTALEIMVGDWRPGRYAWKLENVCSLVEPIPHKGGQGLRQIHDAATWTAITDQLTA